MFGKKTKESRAGKKARDRMPGRFVSKEPPRPFTTEMPVRFMRGTLGNDEKIGPILEKLAIQLRIQENQKGK